MVKRSTLGIAAALCVGLVVVITANKDNMEPFQGALLSFRFDDAFASQVPALGYLKGKGVVGTVYAITGHIGAVSYMTWEDIGSLHSDGHEIGSHTVDHRAVPFLSSQARDYQLGESRSMLERRGITVSSFAWPYGIHDVCDSSGVERHYRNAVDYPWLNIGSLNGKNGDPYRIRCVAPKSLDDFISMLNIAVRRKMWMVACFHRIGGDGGRFTLPMGEFTAMVDYAAELRDKGMLRIMTVSAGAENLVVSRTGR